MASANVLEDEFRFGPWEIIACRGPILKSVDAERIKAELAIPDLPEMLFGDNSLKLKYENGFQISFNAADALDKVDKENDLMKVSAAEEWQKQRSGCEFIKNVVKPFDWTYTTNYTGSIKNSRTGQVVETTEHIDIEKLKKHEKIHFYQDLLLFEDELGDHGIAKLNVKIRVMPSSFFLLMRYFLRVDGVLVRIHDTRLYHEAGSNFMLQEYREKESQINKLPDPFADENTLLEKLEMKTEKCVKIIL